MPLEKPIQEVIEDAHQGVILVGSLIVDTELSRASQRNRVSSLRRRAHSGYQRQIFQEFPVVGLNIVPASLIHVESNDFECRLGLIFLSGRHIVVINEHDHSTLAILTLLIKKWYFGSKATFTTFGTHFQFHHFLRLVAIGFARKLLHTRSKFLIQVLS